MNPAWSLVLTAIGVTGLIVAGRKKAAGWVIGFLAQGVWASYAIVTKQPGFLIGSMVYAYAYALNWRTWHRGDKEAEPEEKTDEQRLFDLAQQMLAISSPGVSLLDRARYTEVLVRFSKTAAAWEKENGTERPARHKMPKTSRRR
ncbi:hypothetical protein [Streptomyces sp. NPDC088727]|uniref:hypothetical protein n=1 Tax=Streptomyces sp. NPDC088727 TaxID=3365875 RepID=UPI0038042A6F